jgi:hypothetical protein
MNTRTFVCGIIMACALAAGPRAGAGQNGAAQGGVAVIDIHLGGEFQVTGNGIHGFLRIDGSRAGDSVNATLALEGPIALSGQLVGTITNGYLTAEATLPVGTLELRANVDGSDNTQGVFFSDALELEGTFTAGPAAGGPTPVATH